MDYMLANIAWQSDEREGVRWQLVRWRLSFFSKDKGPSQK